jgi:hypothetical protein
MKKQYEIVSNLKCENNQLLNYVETLESDAAVTAYAKSENESLKIKINTLEEKLISKTSGWKNDQ